MTPVLQFSVRRNFARGRAARLVPSLKPNCAFAEVYGGQSAPSRRAVSVLGAVEKQSGTSETGLALPGGANGAPAGARPGGCSGDALRAQPLSGAFRARGVRRC